jgi:hypothetical protein
MRAAAGVRVVRPSLSRLSRLPERFAAEAWATMTGAVRTSSGQDGGADGRDSGRAGRQM